VKVPPTHATGGLPLYRRIQSELRDDVRSGKLAPGTRIETEQELMARYGVSRATVRQALSGLVAEGIVEIRRGLGTYVSGAALEHRLGGFYSYSREIEAHGMRPGTRVRDLRVTAADDHVASMLGVSRGTHVVALRRIRLADDEALVAETSYLPGARFPGLERFDFTERSLYDTLTTEYGVRPTRAREVFQPLLMGEDDAEMLESAPGDPALQVERTTWDAEGRTIEYCRSILRGDRYRYSVELGE
jgi:GntR family transcriptional regulator, N-acetylglucosamine utilization regulator